MGRESDGFRTQDLAANTEFRPLEKRKDLMPEVMMDSITLLMIGRRLIGLSLQGSVFAPFLCRAAMFADFQADGR